MKGVNFYINYLLIVFLFGIQPLNGLANSPLGCEDLFVSPQSKQVKFDISEIQFSESRPVFIAFEGWGHAYLQIGMKRLEGHILDSIEFVDSAMIINRGYYFEILGLSELEKDELVSAMKSRSGTCSVTCVGTIVDILQESKTLDGNISGSIFLSDFFRDLDEGYTPIATHTLSPHSFLKRLIRLEEKWIAQVIRDALIRNDSSGFSSQESLLQYFASVQFEQDYRINKSQADQLRDAISNLVEKNKFSGIYQAALKLSAKEFDDSRAAVQVLSENEFERFNKSEDALLTRIRPERNYQINSTLPSPLKEMDPSVVLRMLDESTKNRDESKEHGHTLSTNDYINRHISKETFELIAFNNQIDLMVIQGTLAEAEDHLSSLGYRDVVHLPRYRVSDFDVFFAFDPIKKKTSFVIRSLVSDSLLTEIINHFVMYKILHDNKELRLQYEKISVFRSQRNQVSDIEEILKARAIDPDIVFFAYSSNLESILSSTLDDESEMIVSDNFFARVLKYKGKVILSVSVEPELHGDRSQNLLKALYRINEGKPRDVVFLGTAGAIDSSLEVDNYVVPTTFTMTNEIPISGINKATEIQSLMDLDFVKSRARLVTIGSILDETVPWHRGQIENRTSLVEQEGYFVSRSSQEFGFEFYAAYRISDTLYDSDNDFVSRETQFDLKKLSRVQRLLIDHIIQEN